MSAQKRSKRPSKPSRSPKVISGSFSKPSDALPAAVPPARAHSSTYHYPLLLDDRDSAGALLEWFERVEETRSMPWRKKWIDPKGFQGSEEELGELLARRAYEVWVSEIMLQQTRVSTVIPYFKNWISKWPTIHDLAKADHDEVLSAWKGLGYYSRATRLHQGAQDMIAKNPSSCPISSKAQDLLNFPGIGRYTAGAISSIAFGEPEPVLDGNVARVLSRQLGLYVDVKDKKATDVLWDVADQLIKAVSDYPNIEKSKVSGNWNQAMMELGSTICTPRPKCDECPVQNSCRAFAEGTALAKKKTSSESLDIEDACTLCEQLDTEDLATAPDEDEEDQAAEKPAKKRKAEPKASNTISNYFTVRTPSQKPSGEVKQKGNNENASPTQMNSSKKRKATTSAGNIKFVATYCSLFPKKIPKKKVAEEEAVVCIIELQLSKTDSKWLIEQRPAKGLLASLWQFPQSTIAESKNSLADRKSSAETFVSGLNAGRVDMDKATHVAEIDSLVHVFSHLKLTMHVQLFRIIADKAENLQCDGQPARRWVSTDAMDAETLSTGMRRCWSAIQKNISK